MSKFKLVHKYDFNKGALLSKSEIKRKHDEILKDMSQSKEKISFIYCASGNSIVIGLRDTIDGEDVMEIIEVSNGYKSFEYAKINSKQTTP